MAGELVSVEGASSELELLCEGWLGSSAEAVLFGVLAWGVELDDADDFDEELPEGVELFFALERGE